MGTIDKMEKDLALKAVDVVPFHSAVVFFAPRDKTVVVRKGSSSYIVILYETRARYVSKDPNETKGARTYTDALLEVGKFMGIDLEETC